MPTIVFLGAGSVVFTRQLLTDLLRFPDLPVLDIALHETALDLLGAEGEVESRWLDGYTFALAGPIYAGTNEVQRNIVAERILGLPREARG